MSRLSVILVVSLAIPASAVAAATVETATPLDATLRCFHDTLGASGRLVTINTAGGALLDFAFDTVGANGKPGLARITFAIDDEGARRRIAANASDPADTALGAQLLQQTTKACLTPIE